MKVHFFFLFTGAIFGIVAGIMTFLISYNELIKHFAEKSIPIKVSLKSALVSFVFFVILGFVIGFFVDT